MKLRLEELQRLRPYRFVPRRALEGLHAGRHGSPQRGQSVEFRDYRQYIPGDDVAAVDWKVFGRSDKLYVKVFEHETELTVHLLLDNSASMSYRGELRESKRDHGARLAAAIAFLLVNQQDRFAFGMAENGLHCYQPPSRQVRSLQQMLDRIECSQPTGRARIADALIDVSGRVRRGEIVVVLSDLWEDRQRTLQACHRIGHRQAEVVLLHLLHPDELELPPDDTAILVDSERAQHLSADLDAIRSDYRRRVTEHLRQWRTGCLQSRIDYQLCGVERPFHESLSDYLVQRSAAG